MIRLTVCPRKLGRLHPVLMTIILFLSIALGRPFLCSLYAFVTTDSKSWKTHFTNAVFQKPISDCDLNKNTTFGGPDLTLDSSTYQEEDTHLSWAVLPWQLGNGGKLTCPITRLAINGYRQLGRTSPTGSNERGVPLTRPKKQGQKGDQWCSPFQTSIKV